jgi:hypothetical protein
MGGSKGGGRWVVGVEMSGPVLVNVCDYVLCYAVAFRVAVWRRCDVHKKTDIYIWFQAVCSRISSHIR